ncbi:MAG TPA: cellulose synthase operon protein YhjQ/BcsQ [Acidimicrobiales bacterium]|nr:cellulose synthase operon protein YhjQ/BcsQ [Acidimicrobiales bacterium]
MRVVFLGKGGSGKSTLAGMLCIELRNRGQQVVAIDADTVPGLAQVLEVDTGDRWDLAGAAVRRNGGWLLDGTATEVVDRHAREVASGLRFVQSGKVDGSWGDIEMFWQSHLEEWSANVALNTVSRQYDDDDGWAVVDLQGGTLQVAGGMAGTSGVAVLVVEPFAKSVLTARRFVEMGRWPAGLRLVGVANKVTSDDDENFVAEALAGLGVPHWVTVPADPAVRAAERAGRPLARLEEHTPARLAVAKLADRLWEAAREALPMAPSA